MPRLGKGPRTLGQQPILHPIAPPLRADPRSRTGFVKGTHTEKLAPRDTHEAQSWPQDGSKNHPTEANMRRLVHPSTLYHRTRLLPFTLVHMLSLYLNCPSFSYPSGELLCILQDLVQMFLPLKPFLTQ